MTDYFAELANHLHQRGIPSDRISGTIDELSAHIAEAGADPEAEFGPVADFAEQLSAKGNSSIEPATPDGDVERWRWTADAFTELDWLNEFGNQGWEVERLDRLGRYVSKRDLAQPQAWEYRREAIATGSEVFAKRIIPDLEVSDESRTELVDRLAPEGWEMFGKWMCFVYFKRPKAATVGPAAELSETKRPPRQSVYYTRRTKGYLAFAGIYLLLLVVGLVGYLVLLNLDIDNNFFKGFVQGVPVGLGIAAVTLIVVTVRSRTRGRQKKK